MEIQYDFSDKSVIITGGAGGIGYGMATAFIKAGANVLIVDINEDALNKAQAALQTLGSGKVLTLKTDIASKENDQTIIETAVKEFGRLDVLINNAHASHQKPFVQLTDEDLELSLSTGFYPTCT